MPVLRTNELNSNYRGHVCQKFIKLKIYALSVEAPNCQNPNRLIEICFYF